MQRRRIAGTRYHGKCFVKNGTSLPARHALSCYSHPAVELDGYANKMGNFQLCPEVQTRGVVVFSEDLKFSSNEIVAVYVQVVLP